MIYLWASLLVLVNLVWLSLVVFQFPGNWLMVATTSLVAWWQWDERMIGLGPLVAAVVLALLGEFLEFTSGMRGAKKRGGNFKTSLGVLGGAILGAVLGTALIPIPLVGSLVGLGGGACLGAWIVEMARGKKSHEALHIGVGAGVGQLTGTVSKLACGVAIWLIIAVAAFWP
ncbi:MAG: DUF456 domain-containing protein [Planctomycetota bacterium]